jgi:hypothetical protein
MRLVAATLLLALAGSLAAAADKDEDRAKEAALAFLKAVKAKDLDAVMKTVDTPFLFEGKGEPIAKADELRETMKSFFTSVEPDRVPTEVGKALDLPGIRKLVEEKKDRKSLEGIEKVLGKTGYAVFLVRDGKERGAVLVRLKDGKAAVVGIPR